jgi:hypothetical protein
MSIVGTEAKGSFLRCDTCSTTAACDSPDIEKWFLYGPMGVDSGAEYHACPKCGIPPEYLVSEMKYWREHGNQEQYDRCERWLNGDYNQERENGDA